MNNLIELKQAPIIEFSMIEARGIEVKNEIAQLNIDSIEPVESNRAAMKKMRAKINKELSIFEDQRKMIHGKVIKPYNEFKDSYHSNIKTIYENAGNQLKEKIAEVETKMLEIKTTGIKAYFEEQNEFDFIWLDNIGLNIILSATDKKLKSQVDEFLKKIKSETDSINSMENPIRIMGYYKNTLNLTDSISTVNADIKREKELKIEQELRAKEAQERKEREAIAAQKQAEKQAKQAAEKASSDAEQAEQRRVQAAQNAAAQQSVEAEKAKKYAENESIRAAKKQAEAEEYQARLKQEKEDREARAAAEEKIYTAKFEVQATMSQMKVIKQFFQDNKIEFRGIK